MNRSIQQSQVIEIAQLLGFAILSLIVCSILIQWLILTFSLELFHLPIQIFSSALSFALPSYYFRSSLPILEFTYSSKNGWLYVVSLLPILFISSFLTTLSQWFIEHLLPIFSSDDRAQVFITSILYKGWWGWTLNILLVALIPAMAEEWFFRATLQPLLLKILPNKPYLALILVAFIFSLLHFSATGFLARSLLGFWLGWSYYRLGKISYPIIIHTLNNLIALVSIALQF